MPVGKPAVCRHSVKAQYRHNSSASDDPLDYLHKRPDYFQLYNLRPTFKVDLKYLQKQLHQLQTQLHPDRYVGQTDDKQNRASDASSFVNEAFQILADPYERAKYLIALRMKLSQLNDEQLHTEMDAEFLEDMMDVREKVEQYKKGESQDKIDRLVTDLRQRLDRALVQLDTLLSNPTDFSSPQEIPIEHKRFLGQVKFYQNAIKQLEQIL